MTLLIRSNSCLKFGLFVLLLHSTCLSATAQQRMMMGIDSLATIHEESRTSLPRKSAKSIFVLHTDEFWLNLHHFLYVLGRAQNKERDASREAVAGAPSDQDQGLESLKPDEQAIWREAVTAYAAGMSKKDLVFDDPLPEITIALAGAGETKTLDTIQLDPSVKSVLARAAPIYRKVWWQKHHDVNVKWQSEIETLVEQKGATILAFISNAYGMKWPASGFPVHVTAYANWAGAYSTKGDLLVLASLHQSIQGRYGLETIFHEGMHQWDDQILQALREQAGKLNQRVPRNLSHAMIFFTAGEAVKRVYPDHVPYAEKFGVWQRGIAPFKTAIEEVWKPYLDGHGTRDEALAELIRRTAPNR